MAILSNFAPNRLSSYKADVQRHSAEYNREEDSRYEQPDEVFEERQEWGTPFLEPGYHKYYYDKAVKQKPTDYVTVGNVFTQDELGYIEQIASQLEEEIPQMGEATHDGEKPWRDKGYRHSKVKWINRSEETKWLFARLSWLIADANKDFWDFDILGDFETGIQYTIYDEYGSHYDWHIDVGYGVSAMRKISATILLSEPEVDFNGGDLEFRVGRDVMSVPRDLGGNLAVLFPSYMLHRVTPVTAGVRKSLVFWCTGPPFK